MACRVTVGVRARDATGCRSTDTGQLLLCQSLRPACLAKGLMPEDGLRC